MKKEKVISQISHYIVYNLGLFHVSLKKIANFKYNKVLIFYIS